MKNENTCRSLKTNTRNVQIYHDAGIIQIESHAISWQHRPSTYPPVFPYMRLYNTAFFLLHIKSETDNGLTAAKITAARYDVLFVQVIQARAKFDFKTTYITTSTCEAWHSQK
jgi:hypothetical protein